MKRIALVAVAVAALYIVYIKTPELSYRWSDSKDFDRIVEKALDQHNPRLCNRSEFDHFQLDNFGGLDNKSLCLERYAIATNSESVCDLALTSSDRKLCRWGFRRATQLSP